jgi:uncharacterized protein YggE
MKLTKTVMGRFAVAVAATVLFAATASAQELVGRIPASIRTNGEATISVKPDRAQIDVGVVTQATTSQAAVTQNATKLEATLARLRSLLGAGAKIETVSYSLQPSYRYPPAGGEPVLTGYTANNIVRVTLDDLLRVGSVIDAATQGGANRVQQLQFTLKDEQPVRARALREAAVKARQKADALASALNLRVTRVLYVTEGGGPVVPLMREVSMAARADTASTPIEPGTVEVRAEVTLTVEISQ